jgi:hypothetical protein
MSQKTFSLVATVFFVLVAAMHALRVFFGWNVEVNGWIAPMWVSWVALVVALCLSAEGIRLATKG